MVSYKGLNKIIFQNKKKIDIYKTGKTHLWNPGSKTGFHNDTLS